MSFIVLLIYGIEKLCKSLFGRKEKKPSWG
jgi:hypothetical protein